jgi:hypothetical protein
VNLVGILNLDGFLIVGTIALTVTGSGLLISTIAPGRGARIASPIVVARIHVRL